MSEAKKEAVMSDVLPISRDKRTLGGVSNFAIWFSCNMVTTTMLTGMMFVPGLSFGDTMIAVIIGCVVGIIPLILIGIIGNHTGLTTMVSARITFGQKGAYLPSMINILIYIGWSWSQAALGGAALNYIIKSLFGIDILTVCVIFTEALVVFIALYAIKGISVYEKIAMILIIIIMGAVAIKAFSTIGMTSLLAVADDPTQGITIMSAFDIVVATALSWTPMAADYNRECKTVRGTVLGTGLGYSIGTIISMGSGALMITMILASNLNLSYEPSEVFGEIGFGIAGAIVMFMSIIAANVMIVYSGTMSLLNIFPKLPYKKTAIVFGLVCIVGAVFSGILDVFLSFVNLIGVLFMPIFAIMIVDYFVIKKQKVDVDAVVYGETHDTYQYTGGVNWIAVIVFLISAAFAYVFSTIYPLVTGATIPTFFLACILYLILMKIKGAKK